LLFTIYDLRFTIKKKGLPKLLVSFGFFLLLYCVTSVIEPGKVSAQSNNNPQAKLKMEVRAGFNGYYKEYRWMPVQVTLANDDAVAPPVKGRIEVSFANFSEDATLYQREVELIAPYRKTYWVYVVGPRYLSQVQVRLIQNDGKVISKVDKDVKSLSESDFLLGVVSDDSNALRYLNSEIISKRFSFYSPFLFMNSGSLATNTFGSPGTSPKVTIAQILPSDLPPQGAGLNALDGLVISDLNNNPVYSADQTVMRNALSSWLSSGKALIVAGDSALRRAGFANPMLPVTISGGVTKATDLSSIQIFAKAQTVLPSNLSLAGTTLAPGGEMIAAQGQIPLVATRPFGLGRSWFIGIEASAFQRWDGATDFWRSLLQNYEPRHDYTALARRPVTYDAENWIFWLGPNPQNAAPPTIFLIGFFLFLYVLLIGPVNYLILYRLDKRELTWLTVPVITLIFCTITYVTSGAGSGSGLLINNVTIITAAQDNENQINGNVSTIASVYSNSRNEYELRIDENFLANGILGSDNRRFINSTLGGSAPSLGMNVKQGAGGNLGRNNLSLGMARSYSFETEASKVITGGIIADLTLNNNTLSGTLTNTSDYTWEDVTLFVNVNNVYKVGTLQPKEQKQISITAVRGVNSNLVSTVVGLTNFGVGHGATNNYYADFYKNKENPLGQRAAMLETLIGPNGDGLPVDGKRIFLTAFNTEIKINAYTINGRSVTSTDIVMLFEGLYTK
jgi:hypothetical protein